MDHKKPATSLLQPFFTLASLNWLVVFAATFVSALILELVFKGAIIGSNGLLLDDLFYFERSLSGLSFNNLYSAPEGHITKLGSDYTPNLRAYRFLATFWGDISTLRLFHVIVFCFDAALLSVIIQPILKDRVLSVGVATFAFVTPFTFIINIFANGSYFVLYFFFFLSAFLCFSALDFSNPVSKRGWITLALGVLLAVVGARTVDSGILLLIPLYFYLCWQANAWRTKVGLRVAAALGAGLVLLTYFTISAIQHPYKNIPGRLDYSVNTMIENFFSVCSNMLQSYSEPMVFTGVKLNAGNLTPIVVFLVCVGLLGAIRFATSRTSIGQHELSVQSLPTIGFFGLSTAVSIAPYSAQSTTHIWHYFPHMIFFVTLIFMLFRILLGRSMTTAILLIVATMTVASYGTSIPIYLSALERQEIIADFISDNSEELKNATSIFIVAEDSEVISGVYAPIRLTSFFRYALGDPDANHISLLRDIDEVRNKFEEASGRDVVLAMEIPENLEDIVLHRTSPPFKAPECAKGVPTINWPVSEPVKFDSGAWNADAVAWSLKDQHSLSADGGTARRMQTNFDEGTLVRLTIDLSPSSTILKERPYSDTFPPMPLSSQVLSVYQRSNGFHVTSPNVASIILETSSPRSKIEIIGVEGCYYNVLTESGAWYPLSVKSMSNNWTIGKGVGSRFWAGELNWKVELVER
ncbi:MAG: hypothetical protein VR74_19475 [Hyphomonas sp. BRH_c22]|uniref:hypothetical protein n=1 Tax=Hyphomonas sp. BRH_c22 TaxID=1629710 RepID=UPI0005F21151|nr:hypothetical protein [Hyphomonas sp. BRH_c22]KJS34634.1 MAG: hypothetical protein VR74_19475 [Hyphomonas sp. BRH_c22]